MTDHDEELGAQERAALRGLAEGPQPPPELEAATARRLGTAGEIRVRRPSRARLISAAAAGIVLFGLGLAVGARRAAPPPEAAPASPRFVLLLYDAPDEAALTRSQMEARVAEYRDWARGIRASGRSIAGEKLEPEGRVLGPEDKAAGGWPLGGYFVIGAEDLDAALAVARTCPHVRHGGRVEVRAIART